MFADTTIEGHGLLYVLLVIALILLIVYLIRRF